jgi:CRISPR-associated protein Csd2
MKHRYDFIYLFDCTDANPNGDPDAGNMPRIDTYTGQGLTTDVMLKRKIRNYVLMTHPDKEGLGIYVAEGAVLGRAHTEAFKKLGINVGEDASESINEEDFDRLNELGLPDGLSTKQIDEEAYALIFEGVADKKMIAEWIKESEISKKDADLIKALMKKSKSRKPERAETAKGREQMCKDFYDIRTFGAVMSIKSAPNCGQVRGPVQVSFSRSIDPIQQSEHSITRMAVTKEEDYAKERTMGRKFTVPYGLYRCHGFINPFLAVQTGFSEEDDLELFFQALENAFQFDQSAARPAGSMAPRALLIFKHEGEGGTEEEKIKSAKLGRAPSHALFDRLKIESFEERAADDGKPPRKFADYASRITFDDQPLDDVVKPGASKDLGNGITLNRRI